VAKKAAAPAAKKPVAKRPAVKPAVAPAAESTDAAKSVSVPGAWPFPISGKPN
jgi:hypothetical protein